MLVCTAVVSLEGFPFDVRKSFKTRCGIIHLMLLYPPAAHDSGHYWSKCISDVFEYPSMVLMEPPLENVCPLCPDILCMLF